MCKLEEIFFVCLVVCGALVNVDSFNLDTADYVRHSGEPDSMFGFSVATHRDRNYNWVIVGAPEAQSSQPRVDKGGAVYRCPADRDDECREMPFDRTGNNRNSAGLQIDEKSKQWFGATVNSGGPDKPIVACAPRYIWYTTTNKRRDPVGTCYVATSDFAGYSEFSPCRTRHWGYHRQGTCQAGLGAAISKDGNRIFIGAPGSWYWQGQVYSIDPNATFPYAPPLNGQYGEGQMYSVDPEARLPYAPPRFSNYGTGQLYSQHLKNRPSVFFTKEGGPIEDNSYLGYSVTAGNFTGGAEGGIAVGMPKAHRLHGKVVLYTWNLTNHQNITGRQLGEYFGYAVASADMNGDGLDEVIVGAPLHTEPNNLGKYEVGRVYIIYPRHIKDDPKAVPDAKWPMMRTFDTRDGVNSKGRFGLSLACLGDLDLDGYQDIAIGAPYDGPNERGAVYIYYGSRKGIHEKASQVIRAEDVSQSAMYTFGFSLAGAGIDLDNNQYPDLVVGAYLSNSAFVFRSRPVMNVEASVVFNTQNKIINLDERNCTLGKNRSVSCTTLNACVKYNGVGVSDAIVLVMEFVLDAKNPKDPRMFLYPSERRNKFNETWTVRRNKMECKVMSVYIKETARDKLTPLEVEMRYSLQSEQKGGAVVHRRNPRSALHPVLNGNMPFEFKDSIVIMKNCGPDDVCIPNLQLIVKPNVDKYLLGSGERLEIEVIVKNEGEDSFESMFYMKTPPGINFFNTERIDSLKDISVKCSAPSEATNQTLKCDIGNPLPKDKLVHFKVMLDPFSVEGMNQSYDFAMKVNSTNPEDGLTISDNIKQISVDIWVKTNLSLTGWAQIPDIHYSKNLYKEDNYTVESDIGPHIVHLYGIKNNGPSDINEAEVLFMWPEKTLGGEPLLYIMDQPELTGPIKCEIVEANALKVELLPKKHYLGLDIASSTTITEESHSVTNVGTAETSATHTEVTSKDKIDETGDASLVHEHRGKEIKKEEQFGGTYHKEGSSYSETHSWSESTSETSGQAGGGSGGRNTTAYKIHYTSTGNNQGNLFGQNGTTDGQENIFTVSQQSNLGQYDPDESTGHGLTHYDQWGQQGGQYPKPSKPLSPSYFGWDDHPVATNAAGQTGGSAQKPETKPLSGGTSGSISGSGEMIFENTEQDHHLSGASSVYKEFHSISGYDLTGIINEEALRKMLTSGSGEFRNGTHKIHWSTDGHGTFKVNSVVKDHTASDSVYKQFLALSGYDLKGLIGEEELRKMLATGSGEFNNGTHRIRWSTDKHGGSFKIQSATSQVGSGSVYGQFQAISGYDLRGLIGEEELHRMIASGNGEFSNGTHKIRWSTDRHDGNFKIQSTISQAGSDSVYGQFQAMSGYDLKGLIGEEELRKMMASGSGEFSNGTHKIHWSTDRHGTNVKIQSTINQAGSDSIYGQFQTMSGYDLRGLIGEEELRKMITLRSGEFYNGTHRIRWSSDRHGDNFKIQGAASQGEGDSVYRQFRSLSGYDVKGLIGEEELRHMLATGSGEFSNGTHKIRWSTDRHGGNFKIQGTTTERGSDSVYRQFQILSGYDLRGLIEEEELRKMIASGSGEFYNGTHRIHWSTDRHGGNFKIQGGTDQGGRESVYSQFRILSGYDLRGLISEEELRKMMASGSGEFNNGTHRIRWSTDGHGGSFRLQVDSGTQASTSVYQQFHSMSGYDLRGLIGEEELRRMIAAGSGEFNNGTHSIRWSTDHDGHFKIQDDQTSGDSIFREFHRISGYDLRSIVSAEDLRRMMATGSGEFYSGSHKIQWIIDGGNFRLVDDTVGFNNRPYSISTEESVNQGLDEYTRVISHGSSGDNSGRGRNRSTYGQYDHSHGSETGLGAAAVGGGFRTTALDLGTLSGSNIDENISGHQTHGGEAGSSDYNHNYGSYYDPDLGRYHDDDRSAEGQTHGGVSYGSSRTYNGGRTLSGHSSSSHSSGGYSRDVNRMYIRNKRQIEDDITQIIECKSTKCKYIRCKAGPLVKDEEAWAALRFRANAATLKKIGWTQVVTLSSIMVSRINKLPYIGTPNDRPVHTHEVFTNVTLTETKIKPDVVPLWVVVLSACAGTIILLLLVFLLYKCGFFKRNRPSDAPERQPLNRNGHYQGDEQL